jgi:DNA invertase Pin-like site-specific DNA recombinase
VTRYVKFWRAAACPARVVPYSVVCGAAPCRSATCASRRPIAASVEPEHLYEDQASGKRDNRPGLEACLKALRQGDTLVAWKLDRLGRDLRHLVNLVHDLTGRGVGLKILGGQGAQLDTTTANGRLVFGIFAALAEFEHALGNQERDMP